MSIEVLRDPTDPGNKDPNNATIDKISHFQGQVVTLRGWVANLRSSGKIAFLQFRDGTGIIQCVASVQDVGEEKFKALRALTMEQAIVVKGEVKEDKRSQLGFEIGLQDFVVMGDTEEYPIGKKEHGVAFLMEHRHLWIRSRKQMAVLRIRDEIIRSIRAYFDSRGFALVDSPILTPNACEGTTTLFETPYFDDTAYLTQSGQLYGEASAMALGKIYVFGPTFRAEKSKTRRHLMEFWMVEPEVAYMDLEGDMTLAEDFVSYVIQRVVKNRRFELDVLERDVSKLEKVQAPFPRITYEEALGVLQEKGKDLKFGDDFGGEDETLISEAFDRPVIIHRYPMQIKAFYFKRDPENEKLAMCMDMIAPEGYGEIIGGGQREENLDVLRASLNEHGLSEETFSWYTDLRRFGSVPHAGFGLGVERLVAWVTGVPHVRETIPYARMLEKIWP